MTLDKAKLNVVYVINKVNQNVSNHKRLEELGVIEGSKVMLILVFNDIFILDLDNYHLALRKDILSHIEVKERLC